MTQDDVVAAMRKLLKHLDFEAAHPTDQVVRDARYVLDTYDLKKIIAPTTSGVVTGDDGA